MLLQDTKNPMINFAVTIFSSFDFTASFFSFLIQCSTIKCNNNIYLTHMMALKKNEPNSF